jgi:hypothetical protein
LPPAKPEKHPTGVGQVIDYNGNRVLSAYTPLKIFDTTWALLAEIDEKEVVSESVAAEEMNAQAQQMRGYVGELTAMVGSAGKDQGNPFWTGAARQARKFGEALHRQGKQTGRPAPDVHQGAASCGDPEKVIPLKVMF